MLKKELSIKIDYLSIVFETLKADELIRRLLGLPLDYFMIQNARVKHKDYTNLYQFGTIKVYGDRKLKDGTNWYAYCENNPVNYIDWDGLDAIVITAPDAAMGFGHTSSLVQDKKGDWYYFYWGDKNAIFEKVDKNKMGSLNDFNNWVYSKGAVHKIEDLKGGKITSVVKVKTGTLTFRAGNIDNYSDIKNKIPFHNSSRNYEKSVYIEGDFTASAEYYAELVKNKLVYKYEEEKENSVKNTDYHPLTVNCLNKTMEGIELGMLNDGTTMKTIMSDNRE